MRNLKPGDIVETPHGRGWLLYPVLKTQRREWIVYIAKKCYEVSVDEMANPSTHSEDISKASTYSSTECVPKPRKIGTSSKDMSTAGTYQQEMKL